MLLFVKTNISKLGNDKSKFSPIRLKKKSKRLKQLLGIMREICQVNVNNTVQ